MEGQFGRIGKAENYGLSLAAGALQMIVESDKTKSEKIILLWTLTQIDFGGEIGQEAGEVLRALIDDNEMYIALFQIVGVCLGHPDRADMVRLFVEGAQGIEGVAI